MDNSNHDAIAVPGAWSYIWTTILTVWVCSFAFPFGYTLLKFESLFKGFGADLPGLTLFVIKQSTWIWIWLVLLALVQVALLIRFYVIKSRQARRAVKMASGISFLHQVTFIVAIYLPIFKLGAVV